MAVQALDAVQGLHKSDKRRVTKKVHASHHWSGSACLLFVAVLEQGLVCMCSKHCVASPGSESHRTEVHLTKSVSEVVGHVAPSPCQQQQDQLFCFRA
jgi:hypothetical protein